MNKIIKSIAILVMLMLLVSSAAFAGDGDLKAKCQKMSDKIAKAILTDDHASIMSMYADGAYSLPSYTPMLKGKDAMKKHALEGAKMGVKMKSFALTTVDVLPGKDQMIEIGTYKLSLTMPGMDKPMADHGKYLTVWQKQKNGSWKILADTWNTDVNPMEHKH